MITVAGVQYAEMADSIVAANLAPGKLPFVPDALLGYPDGRWPDYQQIAAQHPGIPVYGLTVLGNGQLGQGDDSEPGNTDVAQAVRDTIAELARGVDRPIKYCPQSWAHDMVVAHSQAGIQRDRYRLLTAHYQGPTMPGAPFAGMHICGAICGCSVEADGTQWVSYPTYDRSLLRVDFITAATHPGTAFTSEDNDMAAIAEIWHDNTNQYIVWANGTKTKIPDPASGSALVANPAFTYRQVPTELLAAIPGG